MRIKEFNGLQFSMKYYKKVIFFFYKKWFKIAKINCHQNLNNNVVIYSTILEMQNK